MAKITEQIRASNPTSNVWVTANAGSGKTKVLTDRILRLCLAGTDIQKILCITFTKTGAAEMQEKLLKTAQKWSESSDAELEIVLDELTGSKPSQQTVLKAKQIFDELLENQAKMNILTIHSFCQSILKRFPMEADIQPFFSVIDELASIKLKKEAWQNVLNKDDSELQEALSEIITYYNSDSELDKLIKEILQLSDISESFDIESSNNEAFKLVEEGFCDYEGLMSLANILSNGEAIKNFINDEELADEYLKIFLTEKYEFRKKVLNKKELDNNPWAEDVIISEQMRLLKILENERRGKTLKLREAIFTLSEFINGEYSFLKQKAAFLDYNDLIEKTSYLFNKPDIKPWIMYKLDYTIEHVMVDEAQDTSLNQWQIIRALIDDFFTGDTNNEIERTLFVVGDEKQSIFSFQGADPLLFADTNIYFENQISNAGRVIEKVPMQMNFRSSQAVLDFVDKIFEDEERRGAVSKLADGIAHKAFNDIEGKVELLPFISYKAERDNTPWKLPITNEDRDSSYKEQLALQVSNKIKILLSEGGEPSEIMILLRRRDGKFIKELTANLEDAGIPVSGNDRLSIFDNIAVKDLLCLLKVISCKADKLEVATLLKSPIFNYSEHKVRDVILSGENIYEAIENELEPFVTKALELNVYEFLNFVLYENEQLKNFISRLGEEVIEPINEFLNFCENYASSEINSIDQFLNFISQAKIDIKKEVKSDVNQVQIMTVHASKGLESKVVIIPDIVVSGSSYKDKLIQGEQGNFYPVISLFGKCASYIEELKDAYKQRDADEDMRLLYVALTRAKQQLIVCGATYYNNMKEGGWYNVCALTQEPENDDLLDEISYTYEEKDNIISLPEHLKQRVSFIADKVSRASSTNFNYSKEASEASSYGTNLHKILEFMPMDKEQVELLLGVNYSQEIYDKALAVYNEHKNIFDAQSYAELEVSGVIEGKQINAIIDRLVIRGNEVWIIDYKSNKNVPDGVPEAYIKQLNTYESLLKGLYEGKDIKKFILWTSNLQLQQV